MAGDRSFETLAQDLRAVLRLAAGRKEEPTAAIMDSRCVPRLKVALVSDTMAPSASVDRRFIWRSIRSAISWLCM